MRREYKKRKPDEKDSSSSSGEGDPPVPVLRLPLADVDAVPVPVPLLDPSYVPWSRKLVSLGGDSETVKIFVDNQSHRSGHQQAWLTCVCHTDGCIRWRRLFGTQEHVLLQSARGTWPLAAGRIR